MKAVLDVCLLHNEYELVPSIAHLPSGLLLNASLQTLHLLFSLISLKYHLSIYPKLA